MNSWLIAVVASLLLETEYSKGDSENDLTSMLSEYDIDDRIDAKLLIIKSILSACNTEGGIRLENGRNKFEGRVEVCQDGRWKTVCDNGWGNSEATVVCRQLRFSGNLNRKFMG